MKRLAACILSIVWIFALCGCADAPAKNKFSEPIEIPENGIVEKSVFENLKKQDSTAVFYGLSNDIKYVWTVHGGDVEESGDTNLSVDIKDAENGEGKIISYGEKERLPFTAMLSVTLKEKWDAQSAEVYKISENGNQPLNRVFVTGSEETVINFPVSGTGGKFLITPVKELVENASLSEKESAFKESYSESSVFDGKTKPNADFNKKEAGECTFSIECSSIFSNLDKLPPEKLALLPSDGVILKPQSVSFHEGETVFELTQRLCRENKIHLETNFTPIYSSVYIEGVNNIYEFDCGALSGWFYMVNGCYPNYSSSKYKLKDGDDICLRYSCDLGEDIV